jgi:beta-glucanase (GH16 family)
MGYFSCCNAGFVRHFMSEKLTLQTMNKTNRWQLLWSDEFAYNGLPDSEKWGYEVGPPLKSEAFELFQYYTSSRIENARCENGYLIIEARKEDYKATNYTSASLVSKAAWKYGKIEVKAKLPKGRGIWPAIWMLPENFKDNEWPNCGEIDIVEHIGQRVNEIFFNVNTGAYNIIMGTAKGKHLYCNNLYDQFHIYKIEWTTKGISFYMNNEKVFCYAKENENTDVWPFDKPFYLKLIVAVGLLNDFPGADRGIDDSIFPQRMLVDYVRVYSTF